MEFTEKQMEKASKAKSVEELIAFAKEEGITLTADDAKKYFKMLNTKEGEVAEEELANVAGGSCYSSGVDGPHGFKKYLIITAVNSCDHWTSRSMHDFRGCCAQCDYQFAHGITMYCSERTEDHDPYK